jgi:hypothetical protein
MYFKSSQKECRKQNSKSELLQKSQSKKERIAHIKGQPAINVAMIQKSVGLLFRRAQIKLIIPIMLSGQLNTQNTSINKKNT